MSIESIRAWFTARGWTADRFGHLRRDKYRIKFQARSIRLEVECRHEASQYSPASLSWVRLRSAFLSQLSLTTDGKLAGLKM